MFTWAVIDFDNIVVSVHRATIDVATVRPGFWVIVADGTKNCPGSLYNHTTGLIEHG